MKNTMQRGPLGRQTYDLLHGMKIGLKDMLAPQVLFSDLGLKYRPDRRPQHQRAY